MNRASRTAHLATYAVLLILVTACGGQTALTGGDPREDPSDGHTGSVLDGAWRLTAASTAGADLALDATHPITLDVDGHQASGRSACNSYSGSVQATADAVVFDGLGGTEMACMPASVMDLEQAYLAALGTVRSATLGGDSLTLTGPDVSLAFEIVPPVQDADLVGTDWLLDTILQGDTASSVSDRPATLRLDATGRLTGSTGCNDFGATWSRSGETVAVDDLAVTLVGCTGAVAQQETAVLAALGDGFTAKISGDSLTVTAASGQGLGYRAR